MVCDLKLAAPGGRRRYSSEAMADAIDEVSGGGVDVAGEATGRPEAILAAYLATRSRTAPVLIGISG